MTERTVITSCWLMAGVLVISAALTYGLAAALLTALGEALVAVAGAAEMGER